MHPWYKILALGSTNPLNLGVPPHSKTWSASDCSPACSGVKLEHVWAFHPITGKQPSSRTVISLSLLHRQNEEIDIPEAALQMKLSNQILDIALDFVINADTCIAWGVFFMSSLWKSKILTPSNDYILCLSKVTMLYICKRHSTSVKFESAGNAQWYKH